MKSLSYQPPNKQDPKSTMKAVLILLLIVVAINISQSNPSINIRLPRKMSPFQKLGNIKNQIGQLFQGKLDKLNGLKQQKFEKLARKKNLFGNKVHTIQQAIKSAIHNLKNKF